MNDVDEWPSASLTTLGDAPDEERGSKGVAKVMESDMRDARRNGDSAEGVSQAVGVQVLARTAVHDEVKIRSCCAE